MDVSKYNAWVSQFALRELVFFHLFWKISGKDGSDAQLVSSHPATVSKHCKKLKPLITTWPHQFFNQHRTEVMLLPQYLLSGNSTRNKSYITQTATYFNDTESHKLL